LIEKNRGIKFGKISKNIQVTFKDGTSKFFALNDIVQTTEGQMTIEELYFKKEPTTNELRP
jgi:hypothetical protein